MIYVFLSAASGYGIVHHKKAISALKIGMILKTGTDEEPSK